MDREVRGTGNAAEAEQLAGDARSTASPREDLERRAIVAAADRIERLAPLDGPRERGLKPGQRFFTFCAVCEDLAVDPGDVVAELTRRHALREQIEAKGH
jgi:hypothetical protein